jgi:hypothetical protein
MDRNDDLRARLNQLSRRAVLGVGFGLGGVAAASLLRGDFAFGAGAPPAAPPAGPDKGLMRTGTIPARAKRVVSIHMSGAVSQVDTFDYKPTLIKMHGQEIPPSVKNNGKAISSMSNGQSAFPIVKPLWPYKQYGESGTWASELMPHIGRISDDLCFIHTMQTEQVNHDPASIFLHTGFQLPGRPSAGAWVNYALGTDNANLPAYVVIRSLSLGTPTGANSACWSAGFLPSRHQGVEFRASGEPVLYVQNPDGMPRGQRRAQLDLVDALDQEQYRMSGDVEIPSKIAQFEMAYRMQEAVPEAADFSKEPDYILNMYGPEVHLPGSFAHNCLLTRRLIERNVKFVQMIHQGWDHHARIFQRHPTDCYSVDQPSAALVTDLKQRGLLDDTLIVFGGEFGRTAYAQGTLDEQLGRDHHGACFTYWMAGGGTKAGHHHGITDEFSYNIVQDPVSIHDFHATMLYLLGIDHKQLTFHEQGRDYRLTDVSGEVVRGVIA